MNKKRFFLPLLATALILSLACSQASYAQESNSLFSNGMQLYYQKQFAESKAAFKECLDKDPMNTMALCFYLSAGYRTNSLIDIVNNLEKQAMAEGASPVLIAHLGIGYFSRGMIDNSMMDEALKSLKEAISKNENLPIAYTGMGMIYYQRRLIPRAKGYFIKALNSNPGDIMALERLGEIIMIDDNNPEEALTFFNKIIQMVPDYCDAYFYAGSANERLGRSNEAISYFQKCMDIDKNGVLKGYEAPIRIGDIYLKNQQWNEAENFYKIALAINPENPYTKTQLEKARNKGKKWEGTKVNKVKSQLEDK